MMQTDVIEALLAIRGAETAPSGFDAARSAVFLSGREIASAVGEGVDVRLSRARLIALGVETAAMLDCRRDWTLVDPVPLTAAQLQAIAGAFASGSPQTPTQKRLRR